VDAAAERLEKIETKLAYLEDFLNRLQNELVARNAQIDKLAAEHGAMKSRLVQISNDLEEIPNQRPPHY
jgi:SlyX protein